ncbi:hypothetical protein FE257_006095 [Aspergillus nanangensis]|uniref:Prion-inhibition and propagation HeLo domain-containing protein n=1 Tax=Aspergillus nanangensis TaxID=2582783 RepID=A0AAD4GMS0_ASPNN|nr:hypothetical protein FE257_006095 [Aspergillus nanangensis]
MEVAGLVVGAAGLLGLFSLYQEAAAKVHSAKSFTSEFGRLDALYQATQKLFQVWAKQVGIEGGRETACHPQLEHQEIRLIVEQILRSIRDIFDDAKVIISRYRTIKTGISTTTNLDLTALSGKQPVNPPIPKRSRLKWATSDGNRFSRQVEEFSKLVEKLYALIPLETSNSELVKTLVNKTEKQQISLSDEYRKLQHKLVESQRAHDSDRIELWLNGTITEESLEAYWTMRLETTGDWIL